VNHGTNRIERRLQVSGILLILGLMIEALSLLGSRPFAFLVFLFLGGLLMLSGILVYLYSLVSFAPPGASRNRR
jgi:type III secretory pathway component EscR